MTSTRTHPAGLLIAFAFISLAITMKADPATNKTLFNFQAATNSAGWEVVNGYVISVSRG